MTDKNLPEVWMRGPIDAVPDLVQPVAHALLQASEEIEKMMDNFPDKMLWVKVAGMASPGFHLQHMKGVLDRLFTYAEGKPLTDVQLTFLSNEGKYTEHLNAADLVTALKDQINISLERLKQVDEAKLKAYRGVGRKQLPSTVIGLLVHAAEHTMRHTGQLLVTVNVLRNWNITID